MPAAAIEIKNLVKRYAARTAVNNLSLTITQGELYGFVGPNGAGKTTTMRMIAGLLRPSSGMIQVNGLSVRQAPQSMRQVIGYMPDYFGSYPDLQVAEYLDFFADCYNIPENKRPVLVNELLELVDLAHRRNELVDRLSRGMKQRLSLARTLIHDPQVLLLDEPASGLDPRARIEIRELLVELVRMGKTVFFSTHILSDVAEICTRVGILEAGELVAEGSLEELQLQILPRRQVEITLLDHLEEAREVLLTTPGVENVEHIAETSPAGRQRFVLQFSGDDQALSRLLAELVSNNIPVLHFREDTRDLEEVFLHATRGAVT
jgi:ABC-2 type transport system ATP-binding protein